MLRSGSLPLDRLGIVALKRAERQPTDRWMTTEFSVDFVIARLPLKLASRYMTNKRGVGWVELPRLRVITVQTSRMYGRRMR
jgi:hypothetical protein